MPPNTAEPADTPAAEANISAQFDKWLREFVADFDPLESTPVTRLIHALHHEGILVNTPDGTREIRVPQPKPAAPSADTSLRRRNDPALTAAILADYKAGRTQAEIATAHGVHVQTVRRYLAKAGMPTRRGALTKDELAEARRFRDAGWTLRDLAQRYHVAHTTIRRLLNNDNNQAEWHDNARLEHNSAFTKPQEDHPPNRADPQTPH